MAIEKNIEVALVFLRLGPADQIVASFPDKVLSPSVILKLALIRTVNHR